MIMLIPWIVAIVWTASINSLMMAGLLVPGAIWQLFEFNRKPVPCSWKVITAGMHSSWLLAAILTDSPYITVGLLLQLGALKFMSLRFRSEMDKNKVMIGNYEQQTNLLHELRQQRHDLQKYTAVLQHTENIDTYKNEIRDRYTEIDDLLRGESNVGAGVLFSYHDQARDKGISLDYHIQQAVSGLPLSDYELVSFISNMLTNALEAAEEYQTKTKKQAEIVFHSRKQTGFWIITCKNHTMPLENETIERIYTKRAHTTKGGSHEGIGTQQIMRIVKKHHGVLDFIAAENNFTLKIKIPDMQNGG
ncbi:GHKL domain-containing protein [Bacillus sp. FJAT-49731]|nr:GHKL domain-containing protein [Lederbergia citrea]